MTKITKGISLCKNQYSRAISPMSKRYGEQSVFGQRRCDTNLTDHLSTGFQIAKEKYIYILFYSSVRLEFVTHSVSAARVKWLVQGNDNRPELGDHLTLNQKKKYSSIKCRPMTSTFLHPPRRMECLHYGRRTHALRGENDFSHGRIYIQDCWNIIKLEY